MGKIQNQLNQLMMSALGGGIAYQHSPTVTKKRALGEAEAKLEYLDEIQRDYLDDYAYNLREEIGDIKKYGWDNPELNKKITDFATQQDFLTTEYQKRVEEREDILLKYGSSAEKREVIKDRGERILDEIATEIEGSNPNQAQKALNSIKQGAERVDKILDAKKLQKENKIKSLKDFFISPDEQLAMAERKQAKADAQDARYSNLINQERQYLADTRDERNNYLKSLEEAQEAKKGVKNAVPERSFLLKPNKPIAQPNTLKPNEKPDQNFETETTRQFQPGSRLYKG